VGIYKNGLKIKGDKTFAHNSTVSHSVSYP